MHVFHEIASVSGMEGGSVVAVGNFDGVHLGHQKLIQDTVSDARAKQLPACVLTFFPHPVEVLRPGTVLERLTTASEKLGLLEAAGIDLVLVARFDEKLSLLSPEDFFRLYMVDGLRAKSIHVGHNFRFGHERAGDVNTLSDLCRKTHLGLDVLPLFQLGGERVSSSGIRQWIRQGKVAEAARHLGRPYAISGQVIKGDGRGHQLGIPTANLHVSKEKLFPLVGVYATRTIWQKQAFPSVTNIGIRPTFGGNEATLSPIVEVHLIDFTASLYDEFLQVEFLARLREEKKFSSREALVSQIREDIKTAKTLREIK